MTSPIDQVLRFMAGDRFKTIASKDKIVAIQCFMLGYPFEEAIECAVIMNARAELGITCKNMHASLIESPNLPMARVFSSIDRFFKETTPVADKFLTRVMAAGDRQMIEALCGFESKVVSFLNKNRQYVEGIVSTEEVK
jgi:hypothetical protein